MAKYETGNRAIDVRGVAGYDMRDGAANGQVVVGQRVVGMITGAEHQFRGGERRAGVVGWMLAGPMVVWLVAFVVAPAAIMVVYSFCSRDEMGEVVFSFTWENYQRVFSGVYWQVLWRSVWLAGMTAIICLVAGYPVGYLIGRSDQRWRGKLLMAITIPFWISFLIRTYAWITILSERGLLNGVLELIKLAPGVMGPTRLMYTPTAVVIGMVYTYLPFMILPIYASVEKLDSSLIEAAMDAGARPWRVMKEIVIPLTSPGIYAGLLLVFVPAIGMFAVTDLLGGSRVPMVGNVIQNQFGQARDLPFGAAMGVMLMGMFVIAFGVVQWRQGRQTRMSAPPGQERQTGTSAPLS